jgi:hypothetical protein
MLLAEALAARKDAVAEINGLRDRLTAAVLRYEDEQAPAEDPGALVEALGTSLDRFESLTVRINRTNNATRLAFDGRDLSIMEAVALRERLTLEAKARRGAVEAVEQAVGAGRTGRGRWLAGRRTKDELRELPTVDLRAERRVADALSEAVRRLDVALQQRNWTTELLE